MTENVLLKRAKTQPIFLVKTELFDDEVSPTSLRFYVLGTKQIEYVVVLTPHGNTCTCPDHTFHHHDCKHILFIVTMVIGLPELGDVWKPSALREVVNTRLSYLSPSATEAQRQRNDTCAVCLEEFSSNNCNKTCRVCSNAVHQKCWENYSQYHRRLGHTIRCVYCRTERPSDLIVT